MEEINQIKSNQIWYSWGKNGMSIHTSKSPPNVKHTYVNVGMYAHASVRKYVYATACPSVRKEIVTNDFAVGGR